MLKNTKSFDIEKENTVGDLAYRDAGDYLLQTGLYS